MWRLRARLFLRLQELYAGETCIACAMCRILTYGTRPLPWPYTLTGGPHNERRPSRDALRMGSMTVVTRPASKREWPRHRDVRGPCHRRPIWPEAARAQW